MDESDEIARRRSWLAAARYAVVAVVTGRLRPLWITSILIMATFSGFRLGLLLKRLDGLADVGVSELAICFVLGLRYDIMPLGYLLLPMAMLLSLSPGRFFGCRWYRRTVTAYATWVFGVVLFVEICGAAFFLHFGLRMNWMALYYLRFPREVALFLVGSYPLWMLAVGMPVAMYAAYRVLWWILWPRMAIDGPRRAGRVVTAVLLGGACVLGCRGGADHRPLRRGPAYISYNNLVNQLTLNNFFTFVSAVRMKWDGDRKESSWYSFPSASDATRVAGAMLSQGGRDCRLGLSRNSLWRLTETRQLRRDYNVVVILMEGMSGRQVGALGYGSPCTPRLDELCKRGIFFERMYAVGTRTSKGVMGVLCGHPDIGGETILTRINPADRFLTLPGVFLSRGYETMFIYGGDPKFDNMEAFFSSRGIERFIGQDELNLEGANPWGVGDEYIFDAAHRAFLKMGKRKFFAAILTVSNHQPYVVPKGRTPLEPLDYLPDERSRQQAAVRNAYRYADWALGEFFRKARGADYFKRTIFVLVADHGVRLDKRRILDVPGFRIPCLIYAPAIDRPIGPRRIATVASQTDVAPTLLSLLGGSYEHCFLGRDVLAVAPSDGFAFLHEDDRLGIVRSREALVLPPLCDPIMFDSTTRDITRIRTRRTDPGHVHELKMQMLSYYATARYLYRRSAYNSPAGRAAAPARREKE